MRLDPSKENLLVLVACLEWLSMTLLQGFHGP